MECSCKNIEPFFLQAIEGDINRLLASDFKGRREFLAKLNDFAKQCGWEKDEKGEWVQFPKQEKALQNLATRYEVVKEHDDGDLTVNLPEHNASAVITTEGDVFTKSGLIGGG